MPLENCERCGKPFMVFSKKMCPQCVEEDERELREVQEFIKRNPNMSLAEVSDACEIYLEDIERWIALRRLVIEIGSAAALTCSACGVKILSGKLCLSCRNELGTIEESPVEEKRSDAPATRRQQDSAIHEKFRRS